MKRLVSFRYSVQICSAALWSMEALASERAGPGEFDLTSNASLGRLLQQRRGDTCTSLLEYQMQDICLRSRYKCTSTSASIAISMWSVCRSTVPRPASLKRSASGAWDMFLQKYISVEDIEHPKASKVSKASKTRSTVPRQSTCCSGSNGLVYIAEVWTHPPSMGREGKYLDNRSPKTEWSPYENMWGVSVCTSYNVHMWRTNGVQYPQMYSFVRCPGPG